MQSRLLKQAAAAASDTKGVRWLASVLSRGERGTGTLRVVTYHRIAESHEYPGLSPILISANPSRFEEQLNYLARNYTTVSIDDVLNAWEAGCQLPPRSLLITFDDAYEDFAKQAWPRLRYRRIPVVLFVPTAFPDQPERMFWWDCLYHALTATTRTESKTPSGQIVSLGTNHQRLALFRQWRDFLKQKDHDVAMQSVDELCSLLGILPKNNHVLGWRELKQLAEEGVTIAPHTMTHPLMNRISTGRAEREINGSIDDIQREIGHSPPIFAYPSGVSDRSLAPLLHRAGIKLAFTMRRGINRPGIANPLELCRFNVSQNTTPAILSVQWLKSSMAAPFARV